MSKREERAAAAARVAEEARRRERRSTIMKVGAVVVAMVAIVAISVAVGLNRGNSGKVDTNAATGANASSYSLTVGDKSAPHTIVIYEDFQCPFCRDFEAASRAGLAQAAAQGKVRIEYRPFNFLRPAYSAQSLNAFAHVLKTSGPVVAKKFHDLLYENQPSETGPWPPMSKLVDLAVQAGADKSAVQAGILDTSSEKAWVQGATSAAQQAGVQATPTILLDGQPFQQGNTLAEMAANLIKAVS